MKNNECTFICDQYTEYKEETLSPEIKVQVDTHLATCSSCQKVFLELDQVLTQLHGLQAIETSANFTEKLFKKISEPTPVTAWQKIYTSTYTKVGSYAIAAGLVVAIGLNVMIDPISPQSSRVGGGLATEQTSVESPSDALVEGSDSVRSGDADSLLQNRNTINSGSSSLQLVSGSGN